MTRAWWWSTEPVRGSMPTELNCSPGAMGSGRYITPGEKVSSLEFPWASIRWSLVSTTPPSGSPALALSGMGGLGSVGIGAGGVTPIGTGVVGWVTSGGLTGALTVLETPSVFTLKVLMVVTPPSSSGWTVSKVNSVSEIFLTLRTRRCSKPATGSLMPGRVARVWVPSRFQRYWPSAGPPGTLSAASWAGKAVSAAGGHGDRGDDSGVGRGSLGDSERGSR